MDQFTWTRTASRASSTHDPETYYTLTKDGVPFGWVTAEWDSVDKGYTLKSSYTYKISAWVVESRDSTADSTFSVSAYGSPQAALKAAKEELARRAMKA